MNRKQIISIFLATAVFTLLLSYTSPTMPSAGVAADRVYINGSILTMDAAGTIVQAIAIKDGKILGTGTNDAVKKWKGDKTEVKDLQGKTMLPGFIDGHSHFMTLGLTDAVNIFSPPVGPVKNFAGIMAELQKRQQEHPVAKGEWITAFGYDPDQLEEKKHPQKKDIDKAFPDIPVMLIHASGHMCVVNSAGLKISGVTAATKDPPGGQIVRQAGSMEPTGLLLENARTVLKLGDHQPSLEDQLNMVKKQQRFYAQYGVTTAQDGYSTLGAIRLLKKAADDHLLYMDIEALPGYDILDSLIDKPGYSFGTISNHFKMAGFKLVADGSPQGKTAFMSQPYLTAVPGCNDHCTGIPTVTQDQFDKAIIKGAQHNIRSFVHCNGDATIDMYIKAVEKSNLAFPNAAHGRPVIIHSQFARADQLDKYKQLGMLPAFFSNHAFFWGDTHTMNMGPERAAFLSPLKSAQTKGIIFTNHTDFPVTPMNQLFLLWTSVVRETRSGKILGPGERLTPMEGLRAITINGAYEYFEEKTKGSLEAGKLADIVILSADPTKIESAGIKDITVLETIKEGNSIYKKE